MVSGTGNAGAIGVEKRAVIMLGPQGNNHQEEFIFERSSCQSPP
jgi:hypothetical protein